MVIFNEAMDTALVLSPATTFMSATQSSFKDPQTGNTTLTFGPMSSIDKVYHGRRHDFQSGVWGGGGLIGNNCTQGAQKFYPVVTRTLKIMHFMSKN